MAGRRNPCEREDSGRIEKRYDTTRMIIADDHPIVRAGLKQILSEAHDIEAGGDGFMPQNRLRKDKFDVVLLDFRYRVLFVY